MTIEIHGRFEAVLESERQYSHPVHDVRVALEFSSDEETRSVQAFWDGGRTWRARFSPNRFGRWTWRSTSSEATDAGLHEQDGNFECTAPATSNPFAQHGPLRVSPSGHYLMHADGQPFFWLADTAWSGPLKAEETHWAEYLWDRSQKGFNVIQFVAMQWIGSAADACGRPAYLGRNKICIEPAFFQRLDRRIEMINELGMIAAPVLAWAADWNAESLHLNPGHTLPEEELMVLLRYIVSRYGAHQVVWILAGDGTYAGSEGKRWRRIGRSVFSHTDRLATVHPAGKRWIAVDFKNEPWFRLNGYQSSHANDETTFKWITTGPPSSDWQGEPVCPCINMEPCYEDHIDCSSQRVIEAADVRRASYWSLLASPPAGITYGAHGVWSWETTPAVPLSHPHSGIAKPWYEAIDLPGSLSMSHLKAIFSSIEWWRLYPCSALLSYQPGLQSAEQFISAACSKEHDLAVIYLPHGGNVHINRAFTTRESTMTCINPEDGSLLCEDACIKNPGPIETGGPGDRLVILRQQRTHSDGPTTS